MKLLHSREFKWQIHSVLLFLYICGKTLRCDYKTSWEKRESLSIIDNILSKYWGIKSVFHSVIFFPWRFFCWSFEKRCCDNIKTTLMKTFMWKCDTNFFEITLPHRCLLGNFLFIFGGIFVPWYSFVVMMFVALLSLIYFNKLLEEAVYPGLF